jgi:hypothetical protein
MILRNSEDLHCGQSGGTVVTVNIILNLQALYIAAAVVTSLLVYILVIKRRDRRNRQVIAQINKLVTDYFKAHNVEVMVTCYAVLGGRRFVALLECKPSEKLRSSHVVEMGVIDHVRKSTGHLVERVFWRFPVPILGKDEFSEDLYFAQGFERIKGDAYSVTETPWEQFDQAMTGLKDGASTAAGK